MIIDGKKIASKILSNLSIRVNKLKNKGIIPHLYIILLSNDEYSASYVKQKQIKAEAIGAKITLDKQYSNITIDELIKKINILNKDKHIHGIIVQRPLPQQLDNEIIANSINPNKDIDGFHKNSLYEVPVAKAIFTLLKSVHPKVFDTWIKQQKIAIIGKGITAGKPIINSFEKIAIKPFSINSNTKNKNALLKSCDIIISAVGKKGIVSNKDLKPGAILIGVGLHRENDGKFHGDYNENVLEKASFYTPTPGGVGPVNISCLLENLIEAAENS